MIKVFATEASRRLNVKLSEFHRIVEYGEIFEVSEERFNFLHGNNKFNTNFVEVLPEVKLAEEIKPEEVEESVIEDSPVEIADKAANTSHAKFDVNTIEDKPSPKKAKKKKEVVEDADKN